MKIVIVCGTWTEAGGRPSKVMERFIQGAVDSGVTVQSFNGGQYMALELIKTKLLKGADAVVWAANVHNDLPKIRDIKSVWPKIIFVSSKSNLLGDYCTQDIVLHGLAMKANLVIRVDVCQGEQFRCSLLDPLGNSWMKPSYDFYEVGQNVVKQVRRLMAITRVPTIQAEGEAMSLPDTPDTKRFLNILKSMAATFHELIDPGPNVVRFLGNASTRCMRGFPSMRDNGGMVLVSQRGHTNPVGPV